jgi:hypothetical protein
MFFRAEQYEEIVTRLRSEHSGSRSHERRRSPRVGLRVQIQLIPCRAGKGKATLQTAWLRDISADGAGIVFHEKLDVGTFLVVCFPRKKGQPLDVLYVVTRCTRLNDKHFSIGARFLRIIAPDDVNPA